MRTREKLYMILIIDTTNREEIIIGLFDGRHHYSFEFDTKGQTEDLLTAIDGILKNQKIRLQDLKCILVNQGPGSFTGTRVGVTVANTLAWNLDIPILGFSEKNLESRLIKASKSKSRKFSKPLIPYYS